MAGQDGPTWGEEQWKDDDQVRTIRGTTYEPWKTWDQCSGSWRFPAGLMQFLVDAGFRCPTPIQAYTWPVLLDGKDVVGVAKTGSGKTLGYLLPGYIKVKREEGKAGVDISYNTGPAMLVCAPTRELCQQIYEESDRFGKPASIATACVYGGAPKQPQLRAIYNGPHCVVATPGRLNDFLKEGSLKLHTCRYLVLDEADRMLDMGFEPQIRELIGYLPQGRQTALFTATWPKEVAHVAQAMTNDPTHIQVGSSDGLTSNNDITQHIIKIRNESDKMRFLEDEIFPKLQANGGSALIFTKTKRGASGLYNTLSRAGAPIVQLHGDMEQRERDNALWAFKNGKAKVLVATDVAQRGLDIKNVECVINFDPAANMEDYVHRIGRTGRAGAKGDAWTFLYENEQKIAREIMTVMRKTGQAIPDDVKEMANGGGGNLTGSWGNFKSGGGGGGGKGGWGGDGGWGGGGNW